MLQIENVSLRFPNGKIAFQDLSLTTEKNEIIGILGTSGCGKSTFLRVLAGLERGYTGNIINANEPLNGINQKAGFIFQEPRLMPWLTVIENVAFGLTGKKKEIEEKANHFLELVGLKEFKNHLPRELSGGMSQRVAIARALITTPEILLLDEPFSALDAFTKMQLQDLLLDVWKTHQSTLLLVTHDIDEALYLCDRILILRGQPGVLCKEIIVDQPRPRLRGDLELAKQKQEIIQFLNLSKPLEAETENTRRSV